jgi:N-sulfoglucosamine sulfohydrolase
MSNNSNLQSRRKFIQTIGIGVLGIGSSGLWGCVKAVRERPNIILIIGDDISVDDFGCYGHPYIRTPNIDNIAANGIRFTNTFLTASSCSPSRCSIITGRYPHNTGAAELHTPLPAEQLPFPLLLKEAGYFTAAAGKWHLGPDAKRAFDLIIEDRKLNGDGGEEKWVEVIQNRPKNKPFFLWFASHDAHRNWGADDFGKSFSPDDAVLPPYFVDTPETRQDLVSYYNEIARLDFYVGEVEKELEQQGVANNTLIMFIADNGRPFPRCKTRVYDSGMQTPFVVKWPNGIKKSGTVCNSLVSVIDIGPTIVEAAGLNAGVTFQGKSFLSLFKNPDLKFRSYVFSEHNWHDYEAHERMVRSEKYLYLKNNRPQLANQGPLDSNRSATHAALKKALEEGTITPVQSDIFLVPRPEEELFDVQQDPHQLNNLAANPNFKQALEEMRSVLDRWTEETGDTVPESLTTGWYDRERFVPLEGRGVRGEMPGSALKAGQINQPGPF